jgi:MoxR-like ATPase
MTERPGEAQAAGFLRGRSEEEFAAELAAIARTDKNVRPRGWRLSPKAVVLFLIGGKTPDGTPIRPKYVGERRLMEIAVATLATDRALLLYGPPGTAKSWVSEHIAAAICGNSTRIVQGTAGTDENAIRYGWNYAKLLAEGPSEAALVATPLVRAMREGAIARIEELTRIPSETQDCLITVLSEKTMPVPEISSEIRARDGFNVIATANDRDRGVNEMSAALRRRFNVVFLPPPATVEEEIAIVSRRVAELGKTLDAPPDVMPADELRKIVSIFRELRNGITEDGKKKLRATSGSLSAAEAISVAGGGLSLALHFGDGRVRGRDVAAALVGAVVKDQAQDAVALREYMTLVAKTRKGWEELAKSCLELL